MTSTMNLAKAHTLIDSFFKTGEELRYARKSPIIPMGEKATQAYWIKSGTVKVFSCDEPSGELVHHIYKENELFPVTWLLSDNQLNLGFTAFTDTVVRTKPIDETLQFLEDEPYAILALLVQQSIIYERVVNLNTTSAEERVRTRLKSLAERYGEREDGHVVINLPLTIQEFAESVRLSRESTGKLLRHFERQGAVVLKRPHMIVYPDKLDGLCRKTGASGKRS